MFLDSKAPRSHRIARILYYPTFSFRLAENPAWTERIEWEDELYEIVDEILTGPSTEMIETVFVSWMNRLQRLIAGNGDYVS
jgi:hypothetical protein